MTYNEIGKEYVESTTSGISWAQELTKLYNLLDPSKITPRSNIILNNTQEFRCDLMRSMTGGGWTLSLSNFRCESNIAYFSTLFIGPAAGNCGNFQWSMRTTGNSVQNYSTAVSAVGLTMKFYYK